MQAGLVDTKLRLRDVFTAVTGFVLLVELVMRVRGRREGLIPRCAAA